MMLRGLAVVLWFLCAAHASAQTAFDRHGTVWFGADFALAPVGRYTRELDAPLARDRGSFGGSLAASAYYVGLPGIGFGAHVAPTLFAVDTPYLSGRVFLVDVGLDLLARLAWTHADLTLRVPFGLTTGRINWVRDEQETLYLTKAGNDLGLGWHAMVLLGGIAWVSENVGLRVECGPALRRMKFDEGLGGFFPENMLTPPQRGEVVHRSWALMISLGVVRRFVPRPPDESGPPLPTPDYSTFRM